MDVSWQTGFWVSVLLLHRSQNQNRIKYSAKVSVSAASAPQGVVWGRPRGPSSPTPPSEPPSRTPAKADRIKESYAALEPISLQLGKKKGQTCPTSSVPSQKPKILQHFLIKTQTLSKTNKWSPLWFPAHSQYLIDRRLKVSMPNKTCRGNLP